MSVCLCVCVSVLWFLLLFWRLVAEEMWAATLSSRFCASVPLCLCASVPLCQCLCLCVCVSIICVCVVVVVFVVVLAPGGGTLSVGPTRLTSFLLVASFAYERFRVGPHRSAWKQWMQTCIQYGYPSKFWGHKSTCLKKYP